MISDYEQLKIKKAFDFKAFLLKGADSNDQGAVSHSSRINLVVNPLSCVYPGITTPETGGHVCQFHHPSV
jgi:hypothetical protein